MIKDELREKANSLPLKPGVYLMMDKKGAVIYVGKAKKLKNRVSQYFQENSGHNYKTRVMVSQVDKFDTILVSSEFEALILENALIKQYMPRYNILLKDDKGYPFVRLSREEYPRFSMVSAPAEDGARYFGPFGGRNDTRSAIDAIRAALKLPSCSRRFPRDVGKERPCLNFHMGRCDGFCRSADMKDEYLIRMAQAASLLDGKTESVREEIKAQMESEAEQLNFERAAALRDRLKAIDVLAKKQKVIAGTMPQTDVWGVYFGEVKCACAVFHYMEGQLVSRETEVFARQIEENEEEFLSAVLTQYYLAKKNFPKEVWLPCALDDAENIERAMSERSGRRVCVRIPQRGEKAELIRLAGQNAREEAERVVSREERDSRTLELLARMTGLEKPPRRMEAYDISNTGASDIVASMVVYQGAEPRKRDYRHFKIKTLTAPDDYASMREVIGRRVDRFLEGDEKFSPIPDLFLIDGGAAHAKAAETVVRAKGFATPVLGMVKDSRHRTRALITSDGSEIGIQSNEAVFSLIGRIQEETHRFAVTFHHATHAKRSYHSELEDIAGVGETRRKKLLKEFGSVENIRAADMDALARILPRDAAKSVWEHYHKEEKQKCE